MSNKRILAISLLFPLVAVSSAALAGTTISDRRYWPSEAVVSSGNAGAPNDANSAFASTQIAPRFQGTVTPSGGNMGRYSGGPKSLR